MSPRHFWTGVILVLFSTACGQAGRLPAASATSPPFVISPAEATATSAAATSRAQVEAWAIATGTALRLTAEALETPSPSPSPVPTRPLATATLTICGSPATDCSPSTSSPIPSPVATVTPRPSTATKPPAPAPTRTAHPTVTAPTRTPSSLDCYAKTCQREVIAPDGRRRWPETCIYLGMDMECYLTFPNGQKTTPYRWPLAWSADGEFLLVPKYGSHDSPPGGYEIWNMTTGTLSATLEHDNSWHAWSPTGHTLAYVHNLVYPEKELRLMDAATGEQQATRQCPEWATRNIIFSDKLEWQKLCDNWTPPADEPLILSFTVEPKLAHPGDSVTLTWTSVYAVRAEIESRPFAQPASAPTLVPLSGTLVVPLDPDGILRHTFELIVRDGTGKSDRRSQNVDLLCAETFFFATSALPVAEACPYRPAAFVAAVEQAFERGWMIWLAPLPVASLPPGPSQGATVYVLYNTDLTSAWPQWERYDDLWVPGQPESDPALEPPTGLHQPIRGFGKVWREQASVRARLGWALAPEQGFSGAYQVKWDVSARPSGFFLRAVDGSVFNLSFPGYWSQWQP